MDYKGFTIDIIQDENPESPRNWDNLGTIAYKHRNYTLGEEEISDPIDWLGEKTDFEGDYLYDNKQLKELTDLFFENFAGHTLYLYDHGGVTMKTSPFSCPWDSGQVGYIYCSLGDARKNWILPPTVGWDYLMDDWNDKGEKTGKQITLRKATERRLESEAKTMDHYLSGEVYGHSIKDKDGEQIDSCFGYYGLPDESGLMDEVKYIIENEIKYREKAFKKSLQKGYDKLKGIIKNKIPIVYRKPNSSLLT